MKKGIVILDFGSKYNQLIGKEIREQGTYCEILPYYTSLDELKEKAPAGIILSGDSATVEYKGAHDAIKTMLEWRVPVLGIDFGMQLMVRLLGGSVDETEGVEYDNKALRLLGVSKLFEGVSEKTQVWTNHAKRVSALPSGFKAIAEDAFGTAAIADESKNLYGIQFHPEVQHTEGGKSVIKNFIAGICGVAGTWDLDQFIEKSIAEIKTKVGNEQVVLGLSGGVDSSVTALLIHKAIGRQLTCIFVDTGLLRKDEAKKVMEHFGEHFDLNIKLIQAQDRFLSKLAGVDDPEQKRKIIGKEFIEVFNDEARKLSGAKFLAQGTIYPDVIESLSPSGDKVVVKSHHNVGGLPEDLKFELLEPLRQLFKDEVRKVGEKLGIPSHLVHRHPFPGPGLGVRVLGAITPDRVTILQEADDIFTQELYKTGLYNEVSQAFVALLPVKSVGVTEGKRTFENAVVLRSVNTVDFVSAKWSRLPYEFLDKVSNRIIAEVQGVNRVVFDISNKPSATIEWE